jgi:hypothetical protein
MPTKDSCIEAVAKAAGITTQEVSLIVGDLARKKAMAFARGKPLSVQQLAAEADRLGQQAILAAALQKRQAALTILRKRDMTARIDGLIADGVKPKNALLATLEGTQKRGVTGGTASTYVRYEAIRNGYKSGIDADINSFGRHIWDRAKSDPDFNGNVIREMWELRSDGQGKPGITKDADALAVAQIVRANTDNARNRMNRSGAYIRELQGWAPQSHDDEKLIKAGLEAWKKDITPGLDLERMGVDAGELDGFLKAAYENITLGKPPRAETGRVTPRNLARAHEKSRVLHFVNADAQLAYEAKYGVSDNVLVAIDRHLDRASRDIALMEDFGPSPEQTLVSLADELQASVKDLKVKKNMPTGQDIARRQTPVGRAYSVVSGEYMFAANAQVAQTMRAWRGIQSLSKLAGATLSAFGDTFTFAVARRSIGDTSAFGGMKDALVDLFSKMSPNERSIVPRLAVVTDGALADLVSRFNAQDSARGIIGREMSRMFRWSGLTGWTNARKNGFALLLSRDMAEALDKPWAQMENTGLRESLESAARVTEKEWDFLRAVGPDIEGGERFFTPDMARRIPDASLSEAGRVDLETRLRGMFIEMTRNAVMEPDAKILRWLTRGERPGTFEREFFSTVMQFKSYPLAYMNRMYGGTRWRKAGRNTDVVGMTMLVSSMATFGYIAMTLKDLANGKEPRDPANMATWHAALLQSGGLGIFGDFILGETNRFGGGVGATLGGPTLSTVEDLAKMVSKVTHGDPDIRSEAIRLVKSNLPYANLWYTKAAMDYLLWYNLREIASPGSTRRMERRMDKDFNQSFIIPPSENPLKW